MKMILPLLSISVALIAGIACGAAIVKRTRRRLETKLERIDATFRTRPDRMLGTTAAQILVFVAVAGVGILAASSWPLLVTAALAFGWGIVMAGIYRGLNRLLSDGVVVFEPSQVRWKTGGTWKKLAFDEPFSITQTRQLVELEDPHADADLDHSPVYADIEYLHIRQDELTATFAHTTAHHHEDDRPDDVPIVELGKDPKSALFLDDDRGGEIAARLKENTPPGGH